MGKNKKRYEIQETTSQEVDLSFEAEPDLVTFEEDEEAEGLPPLPIEVCELVQAALDFNGRDHLSLCSYYQINKRECDCGVRRIYYAASRIVEKWKT